MADSPETSSHGAIDPLRETVHAHRRSVGIGRAVCSVGIAACIDTSLHVIGSLLGEKVAGKTAGQVEYPWDGQP